MLFPPSFLKQAVSWLRWQCHLYKLRYVPKIYFAWRSAKNWWQNSQNLIYVYSQPLLHDWNVLGEEGNSLIELVIFISNISSSLGCYVVKRCQWWSEGKLSLTFSSPFRISKKVGLWFISAAQHCSTNSLNSGMSPFALNIGLWPSATCLAASYGS